MFQSTHTSHTLTNLERNALDKFTKFFVLLHEHAMVEEVKPSLNTDPVKFTVNWSQELDDAIKYYSVINFNTGNVIVTSSSKKQLVSITGKSYNQVSDFLDHEKPFFSIELNAMIVLRTVGGRCAN